MAAATTAPNISQNGGSVAPKSSITQRFSAMFDKLSPSDSTSTASPQSPQGQGQGTPAQAQSQSISKGEGKERQSLPKSQSYNNAKGNQHRDPNTEHVGDGKRLDHKDSRVGSALPPRNQIWKSGQGDEFVAKRPEEKGIGGRNENLSAEDFEPLRILGTGTFARVWQVKMKNVKKEKEVGFGENKVYALKVLRKDQVVKLKQIDHVKNERAILGDVAGHPFITTLITTFSDRDCLYMLLDFCPGGEIFSYLRKQKRFPENVARFYICEIVLILEFLHEKEGVAYRDLKPENILLDAKGHVKLVDFGFAKRVKDRESLLFSSTSNNGGKRTENILFGTKSQDNAGNSGFRGSNDSVSPPSGVPRPSTGKQKRGISDIGGPTSKKQEKPTGGGLHRPHLHHTGITSEVSRTQTAIDWLKARCGFSTSHTSCLNINNPPSATNEDSYAGETYTLCGTPEYLAPEVIQSQGHTTAVDWWALGILMFEFITGYPPFWHSNPMEIYKQILHKPVTFPTPSTYEPLTDNAKDLITQLLTVDRSKRLGNLATGAAGVKEHPWFENVDWDRVYHREFDGPIIPALKDEEDASCFERYDMEERTGLKCGGVKEGDYHGEWDGVFDDF